VQNNRVTLMEAAERFGISEGAVRKRIKRSRIQSELGEDGRRYVYLNGDDPGADNGVDTGTHPLTDDLKDQVAYLRGKLDGEREANRENRRVIAALNQPHTCDRSSTGGARSR